MDTIINSTSKLTLGSALYRISQVVSDLFQREEIQLADQKLPVLESGVANIDMTVPVVQEVHEFEFACWINMNLNALPSGNGFNHGLAFDFEGDAGEVLATQFVSYGESNLSYVMEIFKVPSGTKSIRIYCRFNMSINYQSFSRVRFEMR